MNTERLFTIARKITDDIEKNLVIDTLATLQSALQTQISSPSASNLSQIEISLETLQTLSTSPDFHYPETWNQALEHIGALSVKDASFAAQTVAAVRGNSITLESAVATVRRIHTNLVTVRTALASILEAFENLGLESYDVEEGEAELSILMPRPAFSNELKAFAKDLTEIAKFLELSEEIATGSRSSPKLEELSTTDPLIFAGLSIPACLLVIKITKDIIELITSTYNLREARASALAAEASLKALDALDADIEAKIESGLKRIADGVIGPRAKGRMNELRIELNNYLPQIAARLDNGYKIEGNAGVTAEEQEDDDKKSAASQINEISREIRYSALPQAPVLRLTLTASITDEEGPEGGAT
tara:strand:+ start:686 stop:1771 length:1086 start_codon:yes stop_codon:yes gene_type:complete